VTRGAEALDVGLGFVGLDIVKKRLVDTRSPTLLIYSGILESVLDQTKEIEMMTMRVLGQKNNSGSVRSDKHTQVSLTPADA
jgi:hypothetical protein